jgi:ketosteroid isomerase-like protein
VSAVDPDEVAAANARFYEAFERMSLPAMEAVWSHGAHVRCVHPGWRLLEGWPAVRDSWAAIFEGSGEMRFSIGQVSVHGGGDLAWVTCHESILSETEGRVAVTTLMTTNVFAREDGDWRLVHHHASHVLTGAGP